MTSLNKTTHHGSAILHVTGQTVYINDIAASTQLREPLKIVKFKAQANLIPEFTLVNEDFKFVQQRRNLHF